MNNKIVKQSLLIHKNILKLSYFSSSPKDFIYEVQKDHEWYKATSELSSDNKFQARIY